MLINVVSWDVTKEDVALAYESARRSAKKNGTEPSDVSVTVSPRPAPAEVHADLVSFMDDRISRGVSRRDAAKQWKAEHASDTRKVDSLTKTYRRYGAEAK